MKQILTALFFLFTASTYSFSQNVGVGLTNPTRAKLEVSGVAGITSGIIGGDGAGVSFLRNSPSIGFNQYYDNTNRYMSNGRAFVIWLDILTGSLNYDIFRTAGNANDAATPERVMTIAYNGNVSLNAAEANTSFFVAHSPAFPTIRFRGTTYSSEFYRNVAGFDTHITGGKAGSNLYIGDVGTGNVYLCGANGHRLGVNLNASNGLDIRQVGGRGFVLVEPTTFHNWEFVTIKNLTEPGSDHYVMYNGENKGNFFHIDGTYSPISDRRLKKNIEPLKNVLSGIMQLKPVAYKMKYGPDTSKTIGFIAQQVKKIFPQLVEHIQDTNTGFEGLDELYTMNYDGIAPLLIKAINEQQGKISLLKEKNNALKKRIEAVEKSIIQ
jgi:Chaperone of endosialidase